ncbi:N-acyl homoserine lactonase family protein [Roseitranquillus sediminis]|uniref:N-acyl homoserine lactonase family protein n=1 Tax=Roseitranquillus sediminis TaxID=2809051 RepID=UPI001D0C0F66|nr:N-acyl homoserine lactonase family protein [Roseitranquillus sediminis]MBM9593870.1 N-acyl homoserine lactonase family protein [Roseitranquillus sediminis]
MGEDVYEVQAVRYATSPDRKRFHNCLHCAPGDVHDAMPMDFYVWVIRNAQRTIVVDTGSRDWKCVQRGHEYIRSPIEGLDALGVAPNRVDDVVLTHMHWDHAGNIDGFANAHIHLQQAEMRNVTSQDMADPAINTFFLVDDVCTVVQRLFEGRVTFHERSREIASGISVHEVGGHSAGMQIVRVNTARGWVVLASDATHFYANYRERNPFPVLYNFQDTVKGWDRCLELADSPDHVIPGHDPLVLRRYPAVSGALEGDAVRLDADPIEP